MKNILLIVDVRGWAYDDAVQNWKKLLFKKYNIEILYLKEYSSVKNEEVNNANVYSNMESFLEYKKNFISKNGKKNIFDHSKYDGIVFLYHRAIWDGRLLSTDFPLDKVGVCINNEKWVNEGAQTTYKKYFEGTKALACCNSFIIKNFKGLHPNIFRVSQAINNEIFCIKRNNILVENKKFTLGWSGNFNNPIKNFELVSKSATMAGVILKAAKDLDRIELNKWYNKLDAVICLSKSEGGPMMMLESGACAIPVITTHVGLSRDIVVDKFNGLIVDDNIFNISKKIIQIKDDKSLRKDISENLYKEIINNWTYEKRIEEVILFFENICDA
jgi:glycosyltransferase involved in cell wall biosynthesis